MAARGHPVLWETPIPAETHITLTDDVNLAHPYLANPFSSWKISISSWAAMLSLSSLKSHTHTVLCIHAHLLSHTHMHIKNTLVHTHTHTNTVHWLSLTNT